RSLERPSQPSARGGNTGRLVASLSCSCSLRTVRSFGYAPTISRSTRWRRTSDGAGSKRTRPPCVTLRRRHPLSVLVIESVELSGGEPTFRQGRGETDDVAPRIIAAEHQLRVRHERCEGLHGEAVGTRRAVVVEGAGLAEPLV